MGCWNHTCGISNMPIKYNDEVYLIMLIPSETRPIGLQYYSDDHYEMFGFPIKGTYNDYGSIENIEYEPFVWNFIVSQKYMISEYKKPKEEYLPFNMDEFIKDLEDLSIIKDDKEYCFTYMLVHKEVYDIVVNYIYNKIPYNKTEKYGDLLLEFVKSKFNQVRESVEKNKDVFDLFKEKEISHIFSYLTCLEEMLHISYSSSLRNSPSIIDWIGLQDNITDIQLKEITNYICFLRALNNLRIGFYSLTGLGSQSQDYYIRKLVADWTVKKIDSIYSEYKKENMDDDSYTEEYALSETIFARFNM